MDAIEPVEIECPYCGETFNTTLDWSAGAQEYTEDCAVCCRPIVFMMSEATRTVSVAREDD